MKSAFTPALIYRKHRRKAQALFLVFALTPLVIYQSTINVSATDTTTWNSTNFAGGTKVNTEVKGGAISLPVTASTTDSNYNDFNYGDVNTNPFALVENLLGAGLEINQGYSYTNFTKLALPSKVVHHSFLNNGFLYVSTGNGLAVVDTKGTIDPSDDTLVTIYDSGSTPLLGGIDVNNTFLDNNILYVSTSDGGLSTINTQGTITPSDDTLVTTYNTTSVPALGGNRVYSAHIEGSLLYVNAFGGLAVINTQGTFTDASDDTLVVNYSTGSVPALVSNDVFSSFKVGNLLYTGVWGGGLYVIDTKGTVSVADDAIAARYYSGNTPALVNDNAQYAFLNNNLLYIGNWGGGLHVFDTKGTATSSDDTLITTYNTASTPALSGNHGFGAWLVNDLLYVGSYGGLTVIDTKGTTGPGDDTLAKIYNVSTDPKISGNTISSIFFDSDNLFISNNGGLSVLTPNKYYTPGTYISSARPIASTPTTTITMSASTTVGQNVGMSYRTGNNNAVWQDDFNDNNASEYLGDFYGWGEPFQTAVESGGTMKLSDPQAYNCCGGGSYVDFWLDTGFPDNHFATGTVVTARVRINSNTRQPHTGWYDYIFNDDWWDSNSGQNIPNNQWVLVTFKANMEDFSKIGFELTWETGTWSPTDTFEIDWIKVTTPDSMGNWGSWVACPDQMCTLPNLGSAAWLQYKLDLSTNDTSNSPVVHSVSYNGPYQTTGTYTSATQTYAKPVDLVTFNAVTDTPTGTAIAFEYTTNGTTWTPVSPGQQLSREDIAADSFQWRATLSTTNAAYTPTITSVTLTTTPHKPTTSTSIPTQVKQLEDHGNPDAAAVLRAKYPELFDGTASDQQIQTKIVELLGEAIDKLRLLIKQRGK